MFLGNRGIGKILDISVRAEKEDLVMDTDKYLEERHYFAVFQTCLARKKIKHSIVVQRFILKKK